MSYIGPEISGVSGRASHDIPCANCGRDSELRIRAPHQSVGGIAFLCRRCAAKLAEKLTKFLEVVK